MIAVLYDVHGNLPALEAVLDDARAAGAQRYWLGGDYALFGGWPAETLARLRALEPEVMVRGNVDRWASDPLDAPEDVELQGAIADCRAALGDYEADMLGQLAEEEAREGWHIVHGSPVGDTEGLFPEPREDEETILAAARENRLLCGHTHLPFRRESHGVEIVNPGSVGMPLDGDHRASYALLHADGGVEHRRVEYDWQAARARLDEAFPGARWTREVAGRLERARFR